GVALRQDRRHGSISRSVSGAPAGNIESESGGERVLFGNHEGDHGRDLVDLDKTAARDPRQHEIDVALGDLLENRGPGGGRSNGIDGYMVSRQFLAERLGERNDAGFRGRIGGGVRIAFLAGDRGDIGDAAVILLDHPRNQRLAAIELAGEVDADDAVPLLDRNLPGLENGAGNAGIVDENIDAPEGGQGSVASAL